MARTATRFLLLACLATTAACTTQADPGASAAAGARTGESAAELTSAIALFASGVAANGAQLAINQTDPHYSITRVVGEATHTAPRSAITATPNAAWAASGAAARWISLDSGTCTAGCTAGALYDYTTTFVLPTGANPLTAQIAAVVAADDDVEILLNGTSVVAKRSGAYSATASVAIGPAQAAFVAAPASNSLTFRVTNSGGGPTGVLVQSISGSASDCNSDVQCTGGPWCNVSTHTCTPKIANGGHMPSDASHSSPTLNGACGAAAAALVCASGVCDSDDLCGYADASGVCSAASAATVCRSGACSVNGQCVRVGGCNADGDCSGGAWCNETTHFCIPKLSNGTAMPNDAAHANPTLDGKCATDAATLVCSSGVCDARDDLCGYADGAGTCTLGDALTVCRSGSCSPNGGVCIPGGGCGVDADCVSTDFCDTSAFGCTSRLPNDVAIPTIGGHVPPLTGACTASVGAAVCQSAACDADGRCGYANAGGTCDATDGNVVCRSGVCDPDGKCGLANGSGPCSLVNGAKVCRSGECSANVGKCIPAGGCIIDADCAPGSYCDTPAMLCAPKRANGTPLPSIAGHDPVVDGTCTPAAALVVCTSGVCDADGACGFANGGAGACDASNALAACRSGVCGADGHCGLATTEGPCTLADAASVCRTGACSPNGATCVPVGGCGVDADCAATEFCDTSTFACAAKLANGASLPKISGHDPVLDGSCSGTVATAVCASATCDVDGKCGFADGHGACDGTNAATICRSGACSTLGRCEPAGGCLDDADCTAAQFCNTRTSACQGKLANGAALPVVTGHTPALDGKCSPTVAAVVCASGVCDPVDDACGFANGDPSCDATNASLVCRSGACDVDGKCGIATGNTSCDSGAVCRSKHCDVSDHTCVVCRDDGDCTGGSYCTAALVCVPKAPNGQACASGHECATGTCATDGLCGKLDGASCDSAQTCRSGICAGGLCGTPIDAGVDAAADAEVDAPAEAGADAEADAGTDVEVDAAPDAEVDASVDAGDAEVDAAADVEADAAVEAAADARADVAADAASDARDAHADVAGDATTEAGRDAAADASLADETGDALQGGACSLGAHGAAPTRPSSVLALALAAAALVARRRRAA